MKQRTTLIIMLIGFISVWCDYWWSKRQSGSDALMGVLPFVLAMNGKQCLFEHVMTRHETKDKGETIFIGLWHDHGKIKDKTETMFWLGLLPYVGKINHYCGHTWSRKKRRNQLFKLGLLLCVAMSHPCSPVGHIEGFGGAEKLQGSALSFLKKRRQRRWWKNC